MTNWYAVDAHWSDPMAKRHAGNKAREDAERILQGMGWRQLPVAADEIHSATSGALQKVGAHRRAEQLWRKALDAVQPRDVVLMQLPLVNHTLFMGGVLRDYSSKGVRFVALVHDLECVRALAGSSLSRAARLRVRREELGPLLQFHAVICHNEAMRATLVSQLGLRDDRVVCLGIFDYLCDDQASNGRFAKELPFAVCGSLCQDKAGYLYDLPGDIPFNLYGIGFEGEPGGGSRYFGSFEPDELQRVIQGSFGLVWDGPEWAACSGAYGSYLKLNNPHKTSMYLSAGMPVAIWDQAALAPFVEARGAGITAGSIPELNQRRLQLTEGEYAAMRESARAMGALLREGAFLKAAVAEALAVQERAGSKGGSL